MPIAARVGGPRPPTSITCASSSTMLRWTRAGESLGDERDRISGPLDDRSSRHRLADDRLHAFRAYRHAPTRSTSRSRENTATLARSPARGPRRESDSAVVDFDFLFEELHEQRRIGPREDDLRALGVTIHRLDDRPHAIADRVVLRATAPCVESGTRRGRFRDDVAAPTLDGGRHDFADALAELAVDLLALGFRTRWAMTCLAVCAAIRPSFSVSSGRSPSRLGFLAVEFLCLGEEISRAGFVTSATIDRTA